MQSNVSIRYLDSWPVYPYRTATALLISCRFDLSLHNVTSMLHLSLKHIEEVLSVTVEGQQMSSPGHSGILFFSWVSLQECHLCSVLIHLTENMVFRGNNDSIITHLTSPTTFRWVTVVCGMFPVITGNRNQSESTQCLHVHMRTPTQIHFILANLMKNISLTGRYLMFYNYRNVSFPQLHCVCVYYYCSPFLTAVLMLLILDFYNLLLMASKQNSMLM